MRHASLFFTLLMIFFVSGCKKDNGNNNETNSSNAQSFTPAFISPSQPGILQVSQTSLVLHKNNTATITAAVYNSDGTPQSTQPGFVWSVDNSQVASVSGGTVSALAVGSALVSVTDGSHGFVYISVSVVDDTIAIPSNVISITYTPPVLSIPVNGSANFSFNVRSLTGQSVSLLPLFSASGTGLTFSGTTVHAGSATGLFNVMAISGSDTLIGHLQVLVYNPSQTTGSDTTWKISKLINYPQGFNKRGISSGPLRIEVTRLIRTGATTSIYKFQTSPESVVIDYPDIITVNSDGNLTSRAYGTTGIHLYYKSAVANCISHVEFDPAGYWSGGGMSFCFSEPAASIRYFYVFEMASSSVKRVVRVTGCNDSVVSYNGSFNNCLELYGGIIAADGSFTMYCPGPAGPKPTNSCGFGSLADFHPGCSMVIPGDCNYINETTVKVSSPSGVRETLTLTPGGGCGATTDSSILTSDLTLTFGGNTHLGYSRYCGPIKVLWPYYTDSVPSWGAAGMANGDTFSMIMYNLPTTGTVTLKPDFFQTPSATAGSAYQCSSCPTAMFFIGGQLWFSKSGTLTVAGNTTTFSGIAYRGGYADSTSNWYNPNDSPYTTSFSGTTVCH